MMYRVAGPLLLAAWAGLFWQNAGFAQSTPTAEAEAETIPVPPRIVKTPADSPLSGQPLSPSTGNLLLPPSSPPGDLFQENGVLGPPGQAFGWYANLEAGLIKPHVDSHLNNGGNVKSERLTSTTLTSQLQIGAPSNANVVTLFGDHITLPVAPLNWTGSPRLRLGYRLGEGAGDLRLEWSMVASQGTDTLPQFDAAGAGFLKSRLNVQFTSFTYGTSEFLNNSPSINRTLGARFGLAAADIFFDSQATGQQILAQTASNNYAGVGPTLQLWFHKPIAHSPINLYGQIDGTGLIGWTRQHFSETIANDGQPLTQSFALGKQSNGVGIFGVEGGLSYAPWLDRSWRFTLGYQWQRWWWIGASSISNADLTIQGIFFRGEWRY